MGRGLRFLLNIEKHEKKRMGKLKLGKTLAESAEIAERFGKLKLGCLFGSTYHMDYRDWAS